MSYIRAGWLLTYIEGRSEDYIYQTEDNKGNEFIEDYGGISNTGLAEILCGIINESFDEPAKKYFMQKTCTALNVKLRTKPLTWEEILDDMDKKCEKYRKCENEFK